MKSRLSEIEDDYIGGQGSHTSAEETALSDYFKQKKIKKTIKMPRIAKRTTTLDWIKDLEEELTRYYLKTIREF